MVAGLVWRRFDFRISGPESHVLLPAFFPLDSHSYNILVTDTGRDYSSGFLVRACRAFNPLYGSKANAIVTLRSPPDFRRNFLCNVLLYLC